MLGVSLCTLMLVGAFDVKAADDSYVDLSVLNSLQPGDSLFVETQPLFPIVKKDASSAPKVKKAKKKKAKKQSSKAQKQELKEKSKSSETKVEVKAQEPKKSEEKLKILPQAPIVPQPLAEKKAVEEKSETQVLKATPKTTDSSKQPSKTEEKTLEASGVSSAPKQAELQSSGQQSEQVKPITKPSSDSSEVKATPEMIPVETSKQEVKETATQTLAKKEEKTTIQPEAVVPAVQSQAEIKTPQQAEKPATEKVIQPLIPQPSSQSTDDDKEEIRFSEGSYEISEENAQKILSLISSFENPQQNKIAIYAYNYDNGENSFKKKKLCLDRATEIRSLLLNKGYKNFSIKVINVTDSPDKGNLVEIEEIK